MAPAFSLFEPTLALAGHVTQAERTGDRYAEAGVDISTGHELVEAIAPLVAATRRKGSRGDLRGFAAVFDLAAEGWRDPLLVAGTDGVGTKILLARGPEAWRAIGIDLVAMCVNDILTHGAEPLMFLDYYATGRLLPEQAQCVIEGVALGCDLAGCALSGGETAEMPGVYPPGGFDLAGFALGAVERTGLLPKETRPGDVLVGLASSGVHANGFSLVRKILEEQHLGLDHPAPFDPTRSLKEVLLVPTRIYVRSCLALHHRIEVRALAHITGGGLIENLPRVLGTGQRAVVDARAWPLPAIFAWLMEAGGLEPKELARTFNCGIGMVVVVPSKAVDEALSLLAGAGERAVRIGRIEEQEASNGPQVVLEGIERTWPVHARRS